MKSKKISLILVSIFLLFLVIGFSIGLMAVECGEIPGCKSGHACKGDACVCRLYCDTGIEINCGKQVI